MRRIVQGGAFLLAFALGGCAGMPIALQVLAGLASGSTLLKNEANCSLANMAACTWPHFTAPAIVTAPDPTTP